MKKTLLGIMTFVAMSFAVVSCSEEEQTPVEPGTATVEGVIEANIDLANDTLTDGSVDPNGNWEFAPEGTVLTFIIDSEDLDQNPQPGYNYKDLIYTTTVGANGVYSISDLPAYETPINVDIEFNDFAADQVDYGTDPGDTTATGMPATVTTRTIYTKGGETVTIWNGAVVIEDFRYNF